MADRDGIFAGDDPFAILRAWLDAAKETEPSDPNAMVLATVDAGGLPDARVVLLKEIEPDGLVFYTNYDSRKGRQLDGAGKAAINLHWKSLRRQVRARGRVERVDAATSDAYYRSRPLGSRIGAWASRQSQEIASKAALVKAVAAAGLKHGANPARPPNWGGYRLIPDEFEFWAEGDFRLHDRFRWTRSESTDGWHISRLNP